MNGNAAFRQKMLLAAKRHLREMFYFGIFERLCESGVMLHRMFGWNLVRSMQQHNKNLAQRPLVADLSRDTLTTLSSCNDLDSQLYEYAQQLFDERYEKLDHSACVQI